MVLIIGRFIDSGAKFYFSGAASDDVFRDIDFCFIVIGFFMPSVYAHGFIDKAYFIFVGMQNIERPVHGRNIYCGMARKRIRIKPAIHRRT